MFGFLNINKPIGSTSRTAVDAVKKLVRPNRVGHAGTLDPLATGVLIVCVGPATRLTKYIHEMSKTYVADYRLGCESETEDTEGEVVPVVGAADVSDADVVSVLPEFIGKIMQLPPKFSALKVNGKRAYDLARAGKEVKLEEREIVIHDLELLSFDYPDMRLKIRCGSGTYVRSLGRDIGRRVGSGAIMTALERVAIGEFKVRDGISPKELNSENIQEHLVPPQNAMPDIPIVKVPNDQIDQFSNGVAWETEASFNPSEALAIDGSGRLQTILKRRSPGMFTPNVNFSKYWQALKVES